MVRHLQNIPSSRVLAEDIQFLAGFLSKFGAKLDKWLELVNEFINDLPEPLIWQIQGDGGSRCQDTIEETAVIVVGFKPKKNKKNGNKTLKKLNKKKS